MYIIITIGVKSKTVIIVILAMIVIFGELKKMTMFTVERDLVKEKSVQERMF